MMGINRTFISSFKFAVNKQNRKIQSRQENRELVSQEVAFALKNEVAGKNGLVFYTDCN